jgi:hypothetical protein
MLTFESEALAAGIFVAKSKTGNGAVTISFITFPFIIFQSLIGLSIIRIL